MIKLDCTCDICRDKKAVADGKTKMGPWAYMCQDCLNKIGYPKSSGLTTYIDGREVNKNASSR